MNQKIVLTGLAALMLAASAAPASAQARRGSDIYISSPSDYGGWYGDYAYNGPGVGVSVGFGAPAWGYENRGYGAYAAAPCACGTSYRSARIAPRNRYSSWGGYSSDYASYPYDEYYYGGTYASVGFGWSDNDWRGGRTWRDGDRFDRSRREDRVRLNDRSSTRFSDREFRGGREDVRDRNRMSGASFAAESRTTTRGGTEFRGGTGSQFRGAASGEIGGTSGRGGASGEIGGTSGRGGATGELRGGANGNISGTTGAGRRGNDNR
jgi:hypothetical protein